MEEDEYYKWLKHFFTIDMLNDKGKDELIKVQSQMLLNYQIDEIK